MRIATLWPDGRKLSADLLPTLLATISSLQVCHSWLPLTWNCSDSWQPQGTLPLVPLPINNSLTWFCFPISWKLSHPGWLSTNQPPLKFTTCAWIYSPETESLARLSGWLIPVQHTCRKSAQGSHDVWLANDWFENKG